MVLFVSVYCLAPLPSMILAYTTVASHFTTPKLPPLGAEK